MTLCSAVADVLSGSAESSVIAAKEELPIFRLPAPESAPPLDPHFFGVPIVARIRWSGTAFMSLEAPNLTFDQENDAQLAVFELTNNLPIGEFVNTEDPGRVLREQAAECRWPILWTQGTVLEDTHEAPVIGPGGTVTASVINQSVVFQFALRRRIDRVQGRLVSVGEVLDRAVDAIVDLVNDADDLKVSHRFGYFELGAVARQLFLNPTHMFSVERSLSNQNVLSGHRSVFLVPAVELPDVPNENVFGNWQVA